MMILLFLPQNLSGAVAYESGSKPLILVAKGDDLNRVQGVVGEG
jgi:hypothetical protein